MSLRFTPRSGPLARVAARLPAAAPASSPNPATRPSSPPPTAGDPALHLGKLVDLGGSVELSRVLAQLDHITSPPTNPDAIESARRRVQGDFEELDADARRGIARVLRRAKGKDDPRAIATLLADDAARMILDGHRQARAIRRSIGVDVASASRAAAKLERVSAALDDAIDAQVEARLARLVPAICAAHGDAGSSDAELASALEGALLAALAFDRRRVDALVEACAKLVAPTGEAISA